MYTSNKPSIHQWLELYTRFCVHVYTCIKNILEVITILARSNASRKWLLTINNPQKYGFTHEKIKEILGSLKSIDYWCMADEIGEEGTYHTHVFIHGVNAIMFTTLKKRFPEAHFDYGNGTSQENRDYVHKTGKWLNDKKHETCVDGTFEEFGECPVDRKGANNFLADLYSLIEQGLPNAQIIDMDPSYIPYIDKMDKIRQELIQERSKNTWRDLHVSYMYGDTGTGKTRSVMEKYGYSNVYRVTDYIHPFDNYLGQDVVIFEEYRSCFRIGDFLSYLDGYPIALPCRYNNKWACYTKVYIISNIPLGEQYPIVQKEENGSYLAFLRRIQDIYHFTGDKIEHSTIQFLSDGFRLILDGENIPF